MSRQRFRSSAAAHRASPRASIPSGGAAVGRQPKVPRPTVRLVAQIEHRDHVSVLAKAMILLLVFIPLGATLFAIVASFLWTDFLTWKSFSMLVVFYLLSSVGVTVGYHRMFTHAGFDAHPIVRAIFLILGVWSLQGSPLSWAATHLKHHAYSDKDEDPHTPMKSFLHSHVGWLFSSPHAAPDKYAKRQVQDPVARFVSRTAFWWALLGVMLPYFIAGWPGLVWGAGVRIFLVHHVTWSVNSICHTLGARPFKTGEDRSTNNVMVGLLAMGEGWHNNHHAFPRSPVHGMRWYEIDFSGYLVRILGRLRLVRNIYRVQNDLLQARRDHGKPQAPFAQGA